MYHSNDYITIPQARVCISELIPVLIIATETSEIKPSKRVLLENVYIWEEIQYYENEINKMLENFVYNRLEEEEEMRFENEGRIPIGSCKWIYKR